MFMRQTLLCGCEASKRDERRLATTEMIIIRWTMDVSVRKDLRNEDILKEATWTALLSPRGEEDYRSDTYHFVSWCLTNGLELNVIKIKEIVIDFRSAVYNSNPELNKEIVHSYTYMGITIDDKLRWGDKTMNLYKKGQQRLYFLRKLHSFVKNVMTFSLNCWWGNLSVKNRDKLNRIYTISCKIAGCCTPDTSMEKLYKSRTLQIATKLLSAPTHILHDHHDRLPSGRRHRMSTVQPSVL